MLIKQAVQILLLGDADLRSLVSTRIFPVVSPQKGPFPLVRWGRKKRQADQILSATKRTVRPITDWFVFDSYAQGAGGDTVAEDIDDALFELLDGYQGVVTDSASPYTTMTIQGIAHDELEEFGNDVLQQYMTRSIYRVTFVRTQRP